MGDQNPICTLGDYSKPSHEGYRNTIELPVGNNVVPLRSDTIRLVQNGCSFHGLRSEDPNQHLKDFLKLVDSLDLDGENRERTLLRLFQFSLRDQASNWLERLPKGSITTWEDLTTRFLAQFFPPGRTAKLRNDILMFQQHQGESLSEAWTRFKDLLQKVPHHGIDLWLQLRDRNAKESWALLEDLALYDNESWNDPRDLAKPVKAISLPQDVPINKITTSCEICSGPHDTQYCMENPEQAFVEYASSRTDEAGGLVSNFMASQDARLSKFEADFKQQQSEMTNKINTVLKAITDRLAGSLPSNMVKNPKLNINSTTPVLSTRSYPIVDPQCSSYPSTSINAIKTCSTEANISQTSQLQTWMGIGMQQPDGHEPTIEDEFQDLHLNLPMEGPGLFTLSCRLGDSNPFDTLADLGSCVNIILLYLFKKLNIGLLEETDHIFRLADGTKSYPVGIVKDVEVHLGKLKLLNDFYTVKIAVGEGITRSVFGVKGVDLGEEEAPYWTTLGKRESYKPRPSSDRVGAQIPYYDVLVFRRMVEFLEAIPINLKSNMWELEDLINKPINWNKPPKNGDGAWHAKIRLIDPDGEEFTKTLQSIPTTRKLSERESPKEIIDLDHFYDT
ncbi:MAK10-like protein [Tanacetum coccineum]|uniref:MAK10-like protein n=1 Tax=Tanacetum coccineum TaxID=301880 RepID=A0ABQ5GCA9_9ASTR